MWTGEKIASAIVPLVVALLNLLVSGYALSSGFRDRGARRSLLAFALGPLGVGLWALAWFISVFNPASLESMRLLGSTGGVLAIGGFALDTIVDRDARTGWRLGAGWLVLAVVGSAALLAAVEPSGAEVYGLLSRAFAVTAVPAVVAGRALDRRSADPARAGIGRFVLWSTLLTAIGFVVFTALALSGARTFVDPILYIVLLAELYALGYIVHRRIDVHVLVSRAVTYGALAIVVAAASALIFAELGYELDVVVVAVTVAIALTASALFMGLSDPISRGVERVLFPRHARMEAALEASRGEISAIHRRLERVEKLAIAGELAASIAHEIKNPLSPIRGYAQLLEGKLSAVPADQRGYFEKGLRIIREETDRIDARIAELLDIARADRPRPSIEESFDLNKVVIEAALVAEGEPGLGTIHRDLDAGAGLAAGSADELRGALLNLMKNAAEAMAEGGGQNLWVKTMKQGDKVIVEITDEGPGIREEDAERVFRAFYTTKKGGTGLGLAIARSSVEAAGGELVLLPREGARGTVARITLIARSAPAPDGERSALQGAFG
jgi:signal transduction histidine kinase